MNTPARRPSVGGLLRAVRSLFAVTGALLSAAIAFALSPLASLLVKPLVRNEEPVPSAAIVCLGGSCDDGLPTSHGLHRIRLAAALHRAGFAPTVIFTGGSTPGCGGRSEAEVYAEAARWFGLPEGAAVLEPNSMETADHPRELLKVEFVRRHGGAGAPLLLVTSPVHGRRVARCFAKAGFMRARVVTQWGEAQGAESPRRPIERLIGGLLALREWIALANYRVRGLI